MPERIDARRCEALGLEVGRQREAVEGPNRAEARIADTPQADSLIAAVVADIAKPSAFSSPAWRESVIAFGAIWPIMLATIHGFAAVEPRLYEVASALQLSRSAVIRSPCLGHFRTSLQACG
ncbi:hypothetical protein [Bradyrhizobium oligotrophicum]|uniref:hypothetical protein n=1 Tax=Bradyrhizobium oligotrophicum TaxID=44255 RepID=UPI003EBD50FD